MKSRVTKAMRETNNDIKGMSPLPLSHGIHHRGVSDHALRSRSHLGLENNTHITKKSIGAILEKRKLTEQEDSKITPKRAKKPSPKKSVTKRPSVTNSLFRLLPREMVVEILEYLQLNDLDALFTAFEASRDWIHTFQLMRIYTHFRSDFAKFITTCILCKGWFKILTS